MINKFTMVVLLLAVLTSPLVAQRPGRGGQDREAAEPKEIPSIEEKTKDMEKHEGFFNFYWDEDKEQLWLEIEDWHTEFLYVTSTPANVEGSNRGSWSGTRVQKFERQGSKVFLIRSNYSYRAVSDDPLERQAVADAYNPTITHGFAVGAEDEDGRVLVDMTSFFLSTSSGSVDRARSAIYWPRTKNFPKNTEVEVTLTTTGGRAATAPGPGSVPGARGGRGGRGGGGSDGQTVRRHHSFVELPDSNYNPRRHDARVNIGATRYMDYATPFTEPIQQRVINRHRLEKKDPTADVSEAIEPIVYYVDPGAPEPIRSALVEGASWWNEAFEAIGYKDAFRVEVLPAEADPMDLRYNMILWIHRPSRGWSSGSQVVDPRTGEIICGRVFLGSQRMRQDFLIGSGLYAPYRGESPDTESIEQMVLARVRQLSAHEVGHTLGFAHNFAASTFGRASVMDYPHPTVKATDEGTLDFSDTYDVGIGDWDKVSIAYAYSDFSEGVDETEALNKILDNAHSQGMYWNQTVGPTSSSPNTHQWDNGGDAFEEFENVMRVREIALQNFSEANIRAREQLASLQEVLVPVYLYHRYQTEAISKSLGGLDYRFAARGDGQIPFEIVPADRQRRALSLLLGTLEPGVLAIPEHILKLLPPRSGRRSGETFPGHTSPSFDPLAAAETAADHTLTYVLNPNRAARLIQQHAADPYVPSLGEVIDQLLHRTWRWQETSSAYYAEIRRAVDDLVLQRLMALAADSNATTQVRAVAFLKLEDLKTWLSVQETGDEQQRAHFVFGRHLIEQFQQDPTRIQLSDPPSAPPGAPIGMGDPPVGGILCDWHDY